MNDSYKEILISRKTPMRDTVLKGLLIAATALCFIVGLVMPLFLIGAIALGILCYFKVPKFDVEYEYLYVNGELDVDAIYSKQKRKRLGSYDMAELEVLAPSESHALDPYRGKLKIKDYTSLDPQKKSYLLIFNKDKGQEMVKFELDDEVLQDIRRIAPRKVNLY